MTMKATKRWLRNAAGLTTILLIGAVAACGGGGGDAQSDVTAPAASKAVVASGAISGFGSVFVNGVRFETSAAEVQFGDRRGTEADLRVGHVVRVEGRLNSDGRSGTARVIHRQDVVEGPVQSVNVAAQTLEVLGQTVAVDSMTSFDDRLGVTSLTGLTVGTNVEVSGLRDAQGLIHATRIEPLSAGSDFEVLGIVSAHDSVAKRFRIAALVVDYRTAQLDDLAGGAPTDGMLVEVDGSVLDSAGVLTATQVEGKRGGMGGEQGAEARLEGLITRFTSAADFEVNGQPVTTDASTRFERGTAANLAVNVRVEVQGTLDNGVLRASKVQFELESELRVDATVESVDAAAASFVVLGIPVQTNSATRFEDKTDAKLRPFNVGSLRVGDFVELRGVAGASVNSIAATRVEREDPDRTELRGPASNVAQPQLTILGVTVMTNASTQFESEGDARISADAFFAAAAGRIVKVDGNYQGGVLTAREIEFED